MNIGKEFLFSKRTVFVADISNQGFLLSVIFPLISIRKSIFCFLDVNLESLQFIVGHDSFVRNETHLLKILLELTEERPVFDNSPNILLLFNFFMIL